MKIQRNRHPAGRINNMVFGLCTIGDGLIRVLSFGFLHSTLAVDQTRRATKAMLERMKERR